MAEAFLFKAQPEINKIGKPPDPRTSAKRARSFDVDVGAESIGPPVMESFKLKLLNTSNPGIWQGFNTEKEKLLIEEGDVTFTDEPNGLVMRLFDNRDFDFGFLIWVFDLGFSILDFDSFHQFFDN